MDIKKTVGTRINSALALRGMKQKELAKALGVTDNTISYYCSSSRTPQLQQLAQIAETLNTTTDYLLGLSNDPATHKSAVDELGLSHTVIEKFIELKNCNTSDCDIQAKINQLLENDDTWQLLFLLTEYIAASKADRICEDIISKHNGKYNEETISIELLKTAEKYHTTDIDLYDFLRAKAQSLDCSGPLANLGMEKFDLTELLYARINRCLSETLFSLRRGDNHGND